MCPVLVNASRILIIPPCVDDSKGDWDWKLTKLLSSNKRMEANALNSSPHRNTTARSGMSSGKNNIYLTDG